MAIAQYRSKRKPSGGRYINAFKKKLRFLSRLPALTKVDKLKKKSLRTTGGNKKTFLLTADVANVFDPKTKKHFKVKIEKGLARITSRPGQEGAINAILLHEK